MPEPRFTLNDFMAQMEQVRSLGSMERVLQMIPGMRELMKQLKLGGQDIERQMGRMQAIYSSMTREERVAPVLLRRGPRRRRIAHGAGVDVIEVDRFVRQFE